MTGRRGSSGGIAYVVMREGGGVVTPRHVDPIDELQLLRRGMPSGAATAEATTQTPALGASLTQPLAQKLTPKKKPAIELPIGSRVGVMWLPEKGVVKQEYTGTVIDEVVRAGRPKLYKVKYDDYDEAQFHDFSHTKREWRVISSPESKGEASQSESQSKAPTRSAGRPNDVRQRVHTRSQVATVAAKPLDATTSTIEVNKATQNIIDVVTKLGVAQYRVPANKREVAESPQREDWLQADKKALEAILKAGNTLVPISKPADLDVPIARTVTARRIKIDPATGKLAEHNPFKSRHNVDGGYLKIQQEQHNDAASPDDRDVPATSTVVDDLTLKMFLAHVAKHDLDFVLKRRCGQCLRQGQKHQAGWIHALALNIAHVG